MVKYKYLNVETKAGMQKRVGWEMETVGGKVGGLALYDGLLPIDCTLILSYASGTSTISFMNCFWLIKMLSLNLLFNKQAIKYLFIQQKTITRVFCDMK